MKRIVFLLALIFISGSGHAFGETQEALSAYEDKDYKGAFGLFMEDAAKGDAGAQYYVGRMYYYGQGVPPDPDKAFKWFKRSADQKYARGQHAVGFAYHSGKGVRADYAEAMKWYKLAAEQGFPTAIYNIGRMYQTGQGVKKDYVEALKWYRLAADHDHEGGYYGLGQIYYGGLGVKKDYKLAFDYYSRSSEKGFQPATCELARLYAEGHGVGKDTRKARQLAQGGEKAGGKVCRIILELYDENKKEVRTLSLFGDKVSLELPEGFIRMPEDLARIKFPKIKSRDVYSDRTTRTSVALQYLSDTPIGPSDLARLKEALETTYASEFRGLKWIKRDYSVINGSRWIMLEFTSMGEDMMIHNYQMITSLEGHPIIVHYSATEDEHADKKTELLRSMQTVRLR